MNRPTELIHLLQLQPHPEGGYYREIYRSSLAVQPADGRPVRSALTTIYFLLEAGQFSAWHRVLSDEVWHLYEGGPLELLVAPPSCEDVQSIVLSAVGTETGPVHTVPAGWWQAARPLGEYALVGCTVGPGFDFADFSFVRDEPVLVARLEEAGFGNLK